MDYERIEKPSPQGGGFSPKRLRAMLLGVEKRRKEEEMESKFSLRSEASCAEIDDRGGSVSDESKDVDMVSSVSASSSSVETTSSNRSRDLNLASLRAKPHEEDSFDSEGVASDFEFHKERVSNRSAIVPPFSKPAPSKWDDAQKWIASPNVPRPNRNVGVQQKKAEKPSFGCRYPATKVIVEAMEEVDTKRIDPSQDKREIGCEKDPSLVPDSYHEVDSCVKTTLLVDNLVADSAITLSHLDSSTSLQSSTTFISPPSAVRSVSMRDMGTEMTPIASQEPSRTGTPVRATSPSSSKLSIPRRAAPILNTAMTWNNHGECSNTELSEKELQMKTRREIMMLGTQLGKTNIAAWARKQEEEKNASISLKTLPVDHSAQSVIETCAAAWEEAEKAKYIARFKREEIKIQAWEDHQKAKIEAEMRKVEVEVERMRASAQDRLMSKLAATKHRADEKRVVAEARRNQDAAQTAKLAEYIRRTGRIPSSLSCWSWWCF